MAHWFKLALLGALVLPVATEIVAAQATAAPKFA